MNKVRKLLMAVFGGFLALALVALFYQRFADEPVDRVREPGAVAVEVVSVERDTVRNLRTFSGSLASRSRFDVAAKVGGQLSSLPVDIGDPIERGQLIARLDDEGFVQEVAQSQAEVEVARANLEEAGSSLELAERERDRVQALRERRVASAADLEAAEARVLAERSRVRVAEATIEQRQAGLRAAELRLSYTRIAARWEGEGDSRVVGERYVDEGTTLTANQPIVSLVDLRNLRAVFQVTERDYPRVRIGQEGTVTSDVLPDETFPGAVIRLAPQFRESSRHARVELEVPNPEERLKPGQFVRVSLELGRAEDAVVVPRDSIVRREGREGVFMVESGEEGDKARFVEVRTGYIEGGRIQIAEPELSGDVVVLGQDQLADGTRVRVVGRGDSGDVEGVARFDEAGEVR